MYRYLRNVHLFSGLLCGAFLLVYGVSAVQMSHPGWFSLETHVTITAIRIAPGMTDARIVARELMDRHRLRGEVAKVTAAPARLDFRVVRPGSVADVRYDVRSGRTTVRDHRAGWMGMLTQLHRAAGVRHDYRPLNLWGVFIGLTSAGLFVLGLTGIYLWFRLHEERLIGAMILAACLAYALPLLILLRSAP